MSIILTLIKYQLDNNGRYLEETGDVMASSFIAEDIFEALRERFPLAKLIIYEELGSEEFSEATCFQNEKISEILDFVKNEFILLLKKSEVSAMEKSSERLIEAISDFRMITNLYALLETKNIKYELDDTVVIKLG